MRRFSASAGGNPQSTKRFSLPFVAIYRPLPDEQHRLPVRGWTSRLDQAQLIAGIPERRLGGTAAGGHGCLPASRSALRRCFNPFDYMEFLRDFYSRNQPVRERRPRRRVRRCSSRSGRWHPHECRCLELLHSVGPKAGGRPSGIFSINRGDGQVGFHEEPRFIVSARCLISSAGEGICIAPLTRSRMY